MVNVFWDWRLLKIACETHTVFIIEPLFVISRKSSFVVPPNSNTFSDWRRYKENSCLNFRLARDQVVLLETAANLWASVKQAFWVGRHSKTLNDCPRRKQWVLFPFDLNVSEAWPRGTSRVSGKQGSLFALGPGISAYWCCLYSSDLLNLKRISLQKSTTYWFVFVKPR